MNDADLLASLQALVDGSPDGACLLAAVERIIAERENARGRVVALVGEGEAMQSLSEDAARWMDGHSA